MVAINLPPPVTHAAQACFDAASAAAQASPLGQAMSGAVGNMQSAAQRLSRPRPGHAARSAGAYGNRRIVVPPRDARFAAILPGDSVAEAVITTGTLNFLNLYNSALIVRLVLTWFPSVPEQILNPLATICDPYLNLFRGIIPPLGGTLDLSPILAFVTLNFFTSTAAALPCELGPDGKTPVKRTQAQPSAWQPFLKPSKYEQAWQRRVQAQKEAKDSRQA